MLAIVGKFALDVSLIISFCCIVLCTLATARQLDRYHVVAARLFYILCGTIIFSTLLLVAGLLNSDFGLRYVYMHTNRTLDPIYKVTALWGGQEGSMLFWCFLLSLVSIFAIRGLLKRRIKLVAPSVAVISAVLFFFHAIMVFAEDPFARMPEMPFDGRGLNPLLQNWSMAIHPPCLYMGFILCTIPFAISVATVVNRNVDRRWIRETRSWSILAWLFLSAGNLLGGEWAYKELGWGGFWAWDPVENAAIMPWFTTTAYIHSIMVQEKRGLLKLWNFTLVAISFCLTILGTFLTRSGVITSVHAFAKSNLGDFFLIFLLLSVIFCVFLAIKYYREFRPDGEIDSLYSREAFFVLNNILLTVSAFAILWGTVFPIFSELFTGSKITVGPPFFNKFMVPIGLLLLFLMGIGQVLPWRKTLPRIAVKLFSLPSLAAVPTLLITILYLPWSKTSVYVACCFALLAFALVGIVQEIFRGVKHAMKHDRTAWYVALLGLFRAQQRRYGGFIAHLGFLFILFGVSGLAFKVEREILLQRGQSVEIGQYNILYSDLRFGADKHKEALFADLVVSRGDDTFSLTPARFFYKSTPSSGGEPQTSTEVAIYRNLKEDLYTVLHTANLETKSATFLFTVNPFVFWLWFGGFILIGGGIITVLPRFSSRKLRAIQLEKQSLILSLSDLENDFESGKIETSFYQTQREEMIEKIVVINRNMQAGETDLAELQKEILSDLESLSITNENPTICHVCGMPYEEAVSDVPDTFCRNCGQRKKVG